MKKVILAATTLLLATQAAQAAVLVSNLGNGVTSNNDLNAPGVAIPFTVGSSDVTLESVTLRVDAQGFSNIDGSVFYTTAIHNDNTGSFGSLFHSINTVEDTSLVGQENLTIPALTPFVLNANTTYWLFAQVGPGDNAGWNATSDTSETGETGWSIGNGAILVGSFNIDPVKFSIDGTPVVPEPSTYAAAAGLLVGAVALIRRRRRA